MNQKLGYGFKGSKRLGGGFIMYDLEDQEEALEFLRKDLSNVFGMDIPIYFRVLVSENPQLILKDEMISFILGMSASNHDIEAVFIDGVYKLMKVDIKEIGPFLDRLNRVSRINNIEFYISLSAKPEDMAEYESEEVKILD